MSSTPKSKAPAGAAPRPKPREAAHSTSPPKPRPKSPKAAAPQAAGTPAAGVEVAAGPHRAGFVAIIGRPNVGKSTLLNRIVGEKLAIASPRPQTTRNRLLAVKNLPAAQLALVDTPGLHRPHGKGRSMLNKFMVDQALSALADVDVVLVVTDVRALERRPRPERNRRKGLADEGQPKTKDPKDPKQAGEGYRGPALLDAADRFVAESLGASKKPVIMALNKVDSVRDKRKLLPLLDAWSKLCDFRGIVPISALRGDNVERLISELCAVLPEGPRLFPEEMVTDRAERWLAAELIREQVFLATRQEVPYAVAVTIDSWEDRLQPRGRKKGRRLSVFIDATVHVEKDAQKRIVVGEGGHLVRDVGIAARAEIGRLLDCPVHLSLFVRVDMNWTTSPAGMRDMGYGPE